MSAAAAVVVVVEEEEEVDEDDDEDDRDGDVDENMDDRKEAGGQRGGSGRGGSRVSIYHILYDICPIRYIPPWPYTIDSLASMARCMHLWFKFTSTAWPAMLQPAA
jgi:hypothetical protein